MDWIDQIAAQNEQKADRANADAQAAIAASLLLGREMPEFMRQLGVELEAMVAKLPKVGVTASFSNHSQADFETRYHISLCRSHLPPAVTDIGVFHQTGSHTIRCHPRHREAYDLHFTCNPQLSGIGLYSKTNISLMDPHKAARFILAPEAEFVRPQ